MQHTTGDGDGADKARRQHVWDRDGADRATAPPLVAAGSERGGEGDAVGGRRRGTTDITHGAVAPAAMGAAAALLGWEGLPENPVGGSSPMDFLGLTDSTQLDRLKPAPHGVVRLTNGENWGRQSDDKTNRTAGRGRTD